MTNKRHTGINLRRYLCSLLCAAATLGAMSTSAVAQDELPPLGESKITYAHGPWGTSSVVFVVIEMLERVGYDVEPKLLDTGLAYQALATGNAEIWSNAYLPGQQEYLNKHGDKLDIISMSYGPVPGGLMVPAYVPVSSIAELKDPANRDMFDGKIVGISAGAGVMKQAQRAIDEYGLDFELVASGSSAMATTFKAAYEKEEPVIVTGWCPHYLCAKYDVKFLSDDKGIYQYSQDYHIVRQGFREDYPRATVVLSRMTIVSSLASEMLVWMEDDGIDFKAAAKRFVDENPELVWYWIGDLVPDMEKPASLQ